MKKGENATLPPIYVRFSGQMLQLIWRLGFDCERAHNLFK